MTVQVFDDRTCTLGEGPLWHPGRKQLFWFDIIGCKLLSRSGDEQLSWQFDEHVSAAGWVDEDTLLIASETGLHRFDIGSGQHERIAVLEDKNPATRSNDGRADPHGGFWIGTMGKDAAPRAGAIYRFHAGQIELLYPEITISNSICFAPDGRTAYFADTPTSRIMRQTLDDRGWPEGPAEVFVDLGADGLNPDGSVVDAEGCLWNAQWGASRVARYDADGRFLSAVEFSARQISCPAFGGADLTTLFATSAAEGLRGDDPVQGQTFAKQTDTRGQAEHRVILR